MNNKNIISEELDTDSTLDDDTLMFTSKEEFSLYIEAKSVLDESDVLTTLVDYMTERMLEYSDIKHLLTKYLLFKIEEVALKRRLLKITKLY